MEAVSTIRALKLTHGLYDSFLFSVEVSFHHGRLFTNIKYRGHSRRLVVEKILITSGSQHKVFGRHRRAEVGFVKYTPDIKLGRVFRAFKI